MRLLNAFQGSYGFCNYGCANLLHNGQNRRWQLRWHQNRSALLHWPSARNGLLMVLFPFPRIRGQACWHTESLPQTRMFNTALQLASGLLLWTVIKVSNEVSCERREVRLWEVLRPEHRLRTGGGRPHADWNQSVLRQEPLLSDPGQEGCVRSCR